MTFLHKLAQRLARLKTALIMAVIATIACEIPMRQSDPPDVASLQVSPQSLTLPTNQIAQFVAVGFTSAGDTARFSVTWSATGGSIVDTSTSGGRHYISYKAPSQPGQYEVIIQIAAAGSSPQGASPWLSAQSTAAGLSDSAVVNVTGVPVASVSISPAAASAWVGQTVQLTASTLDSSGASLSGRTVTWASSNSAIARVNASGLVTAVGVGSATITATSEGKSGTATVTVTLAPVASVTVNPSAVGATIADQAQFTATLQDVNGNVLTGRVVTWASSDVGVATVNGSGLVTAVAAGLSIITATSEGKNGTAGITVTATPVAVASVSVSPASANVTAGQTVQLTATPRDASGNVLLGRVVTWASSNGALATVSNSGLVTGVAAGAVTITATSEGQSGSSTVTVLSADTSPPVISNGQPTGTLPSGTTQTTMRVTTNEAATCKWGTSSSTSYGSLANTFTTTGGTSHSTLLTGLSDGQSYTRYVRCQDGAGNANGSSYAVSFSVATASGGFAPPDIASADFQDGTFGPFNNDYGANITIIDDPTGAGFGKVGRFLYHIEGPGNQDGNTALDYTIPSTHTDLYYRIYVYFVDPGVQSGIQIELIPSGLQRKLIYINAGEGPDYWTGTIQRWLGGASGEMDQGIYGPRSVTKSGQPQYSEIEVSHAIDVRLNTWYYFEYRVKLNTPGLSDGRIQIWGGIKGAPGLANALLYDIQNADIRHSSTNAHKSVRFGQQLDAFTNGIYIVDDTRYVKNIAISTQRIGP